MSKEIDNSLFQDLARIIDGKEIMSPVATQLEKQYGRGFAEKNLRRMMKFADTFSDIEIVATLSRQLSWSHFVELLPIKSSEARIY